MIHVLDTIDALDIEQSEVSRSEGRDRRVRRIYQYVLKTSLLEGKHIFKLPLMSGGELIVDDEFRTAVEQNGLQGLRFKPIPMKPLE